MPGYAHNLPRELLGAFSDPPNHRPEKATRKSTCTSSFASWLLLFLLSWGWHLCYYAAYFDIKKKSHINLVLRNLSWKMIFGWPTFKILCDTTILYKLLKVKLKTKKAIMRTLNQLKVHFWLFFFLQYLYEIPSCG